MTFGSLLVDIDLAQSPILAHGATDRFNNPSFWSYYVSAFEHLKDFVEHSTSETS